MMVDGLLVPPFSREAEEAVLGGLLVSARSIVRIADILTPDAFYISSNARLYSELQAAIAELPDDGSAVDWLTLSERIEGTDLALEWPGDRLVELASTTPSTANIRAYAEIVRELSDKRELIGLYTEAVSSLYRERHLSSAAVAAKLHQATLHITGRADRGQGLQPMRVYLRDWLAQLQERYHNGDLITGLASPWPSVDALTFGWQPGELIIVAGRPGMGKTIIGWEQAMHTGASGKRAAKFSLEMSGKQLMQRGVASRGRVPNQWLRSPSAWKGGDDTEFWARTTAAVQSMMADRLLIDETPSLTVGQIEARADRAHTEDPLALVVVDHLHIMDPEQKSGQNMADALAKASGGLKRLAKRLNIPVMALAQLNRANTQRPDKRPTMADLRASGAIEQDADYVALLHRPDYYKPPGSPQDQRLEWIWGKGRDVPTGEATILRSRYDEMRAEEWGPEGPPPEALEQPEGPPARARGWGKSGSKALTYKGDE